MGLLGSMFSFLPLFLLSWVQLAIVVFLVNQWCAEAEDNANIEGTKRPSHLVLYEFYTALMDRTLKAYACLALSHG